MGEEKRSDTPQKGLRGTISNIDITQLLQMVCVGNTPLMVRAVSEGKEGVFYVKDGHVIHALANQKEGEEAFWEISLWNDAVFDIVPYATNDVPCTISKPWEYLALECARIRDEHAKERLIHVLIIDDSAFFAKQLKRLIEEDPDFVVVGIANNGEEAIGYMEDELVDIVTLDAFMPVMPGDTTLKHLMVRYGVPVVVVSAFLEGSSDVLFDFLRLGAVDIVSKPQNRSSNMEQYGRTLRSVLKKASNAKVENFRRWKPKAAQTPWEPITEDQSSKFLAIVGFEGSHADWFRLPFRDFLSSGYVGCFSGIDQGFIAAIAELVGNYHGCPVKTFSGKEQSKDILERNAINFFHALSGWYFEKGESGYKAVETDQGISRVDRNETVEMTLLRLADVFNSDLGILCLSGAEAFSDKWLDAMIERQIKWFLPSPDLLLFPQMVESVLGKARALQAKGRSLELFQGTYEDLASKWKPISL